MAKTPTNHGKEWSNQEINDLQRLANQNTPTRVIGLKLGRTSDAVRTKAARKTFHSSRRINHHTIGARRFTGILAVGTFLSQEEEICLTKS